MDQLYVSGHQNEMITGHNFYDRYHNSGYLCKKQGFTYNGIHSYPGMPFEFSHENNSKSFNLFYMATTQQGKTRILSTKPSKTDGKTGKMANSEFHKFFVDELKDIYWAEKHLVKALPKMQKSATSKELAAAFEKHTKETQQHIETLEKVFELLEEKAVAKKCDAMAGLLEEANSIIADTEKGTMIRDAGLILAAQKVEHYEIATYGTLRTFAAGMGHTDVEQLLQQTLDNEKETDEALTGIAEGSVNEEAAAE